MPYDEIFPSRSAAQKREYKIKGKKSSKYLRWLIRQAYPALELL